MATAFNLTAQLNLRGPNNVNKIVADIKKQLSGITANINMKLDPNVAKNTKSLDAALKSLNSTLSKTASSATSAASAVSAFGRAVQSVSIKNIPSQINATVSSMNRLNKSSSTVGKALAESATEMQEFGKQAGLAIRRFAAFTAVTGVIYSLTNSVTQGISAYIEYDRELVRLQQVTGETAGGLKNLQQSISQLATTLGVSSKELTTVSVTLAQAGLSAKDTERALQALALSSLAPSFDDMNETVEGSIALMRQFGISAGQLEGALGSINAVAAAFAVEADDLITAIQRTGGVFATASKGVSEGTDALNEFIAVFTSVRATTRESAETIATGLRTIFTRIQRGSTIDALKEFGVTLTDSEGKFVGAYKAVQLLSEGLSKLDPRDIKFSRIVEELGGFRQIGKVIPLIQQFATAQDALKIAQAGQGSLAKDAATAQLSLANQIQKVREEFFALFREIGQSKGFQSLVTGVLTLTRGLIKLADVSKGLLPALSVILAFKGASALTQFASGFSKGFRPGGGKPNQERPRFANGGQVKYFATGGSVPGSGGADSVPAMLTPGEFVINKKAASRIGRKTLHRANKYAGGGQAIKAGIADIDVTDVHDGDTFTASVTPKTEPFSAEFRLWGYDAYEQGNKKSRITPTKLSQIKKYNTRSGALTEIDESDNPITIPAYTRVKQGTTAKDAAGEGKKTLETKLKNLNKPTMIDKINSTLDTEGGFGRYAANLGQLLPDDLTTGRYQSKNMGGVIQKFARGSKVEFGTGETVFPARIRKKYAEEKQTADENLKAKMAWDQYPQAERISVDESKVKEAFQQPFDQAKFIESFKQKISRNTLFSRMADFAKFIGLPQEDLSAVLPLQLDFGGPGISSFVAAQFSKGATGSRIYEGYDLSRFRYGESQTQEAYGLEKLIESKKKEIAKIIKTPTRTFDDGSFGIDNEAYSKADEELRALQTKATKLRDLKYQAQKTILAEQNSVASSSGRGTVSFGPSLGYQANTQNHLMYHELTHQLFEGLRARSQESFDKYKTRVVSLFTGDNDDLADAFDALTAGRGYSSADVVYGRSYKSRHLTEMLTSYYRQNSLSDIDRIKEPVPEDITTNLASLNTQSETAKRAREYRPINPKINQALLTGKYAMSQDIIDKMEDNGKEEFLTTLVQNAPELDQNLQGILNSTLTELLGGAGIKRQQYLSGGRVQRFAVGGKTKPQKERFSSSPTPMLKAILANIEKKPIQKEYSFRSYQEELTRVLNQAYKGILIGGTKPIKENITKDTIVSMYDQYTGTNRYIDVSVGALEDDLKYITGGDTEKGSLKKRKGVEVGDMLDVIRSYQGLGLDYTLNAALATGRTNETLGEFQGKDLSEVYKKAGLDKVKLSTFVKQMDAAAQFKFPEKLYSGLGDSKLDLILKDTNTKNQKDLDNIIGKTFTMPSFLSASDAEGLAMSFARVGMLTILTNPKRKGIIPEKSKDTTINRESQDERSKKLRILQTATGQEGFAGLPIDEDYTDAYDSEGEYIFPSNSKFRINSIDKRTAKLFDKDAGHKHLDMEIQQLAKGGIAQRKVGYIDYDVIANPANESAIKRGMEETGVTGPRLYTDHLTQLAVKARKNSNLQKLRAVYGVAGSGKTTLARGQGTDNAKLRQTERFPILSPEDIQRATEVIVLSSSVSKDKLDNIFDATDRTYTLSSTTKEEKEIIGSNRESRDITGKGLENRKPGSTRSVAKDSAVGEALLSDRLGDRSVVLGRSGSGRLRRKQGNELVEVIKKKIGFTWGGYSPMTAGHESIMDAASAMGISPEDFIYLVGSNEGITPGKEETYRTAIFDQDARVLLAKAGAGARGATVLPKPRDFEVPQAFDLSEEGQRRRVLIPAKGSSTFVADKTPAETEKYKTAGYKVQHIERTGGISGTMVRQLIKDGNLGELQKVLSPGVYDLISNNIGRIQNRANILPSIIQEVQQVQGTKLADVEKQIKATGITKIENKKVASDPEYAAKVEVLKELREKRDQIKSSASFEPHRLLATLAAKEPDKYGLDLSMPQITTASMRTMSNRQPQQANLGGIIQRFVDGGIADESNITLSTKSVSETARSNNISLQDAILKHLADMKGIAGIRQIASIPAGDRRISQVLRSTSVREGKYLDEATGYVDKALSARSSQQRDKTRAIQKSSKAGLLFGAAGVLGTPFAPIKKTVGAGVLKSPTDVYVTSGTLQPDTALRLESLLSNNIDKTTKRAAKKVMIDDILRQAGLGKILQLDFDKTLAFGADKIQSTSGSSFAAFSDPQKIQEGLANARLSSLGQELVKLVAEKPELINNMRVVTARPQKTLDMVQSWLSSKGLPIPLSQFTGVGGTSVSGSQISKLKAAVLAPNSVFVDDDKSNIREARKAKKGIATYRYGLNSVKPDANREGTTQGNMFERVIEALGGPKANKVMKGIDFPTGLKSAGKYFGISGNIPTDAKRTLNGPSTVEANIVSYLKANGYKQGGKVDYYSLEKFSGLSSRAFDGMVQYAKTNDFSLDEFRSYLSKRAAEKQNKVGSVIDPKSLQSFLMHGATGARLGTGDLTEQQKQLAEMLKSDRPDPKYNPDYDRARGYAGGGAVSLYHGSNTGVNDIETFAKGGKAKNNIIRSSVSDLVASFGKGSSSSGEVVASSIGGGLYAVTSSQASGGGRSLYDAVMEMATSKGSKLVSDRSRVSDSALTKIWTNYFSKGVGQDGKPVAKSPLPADQMYTGSFFKDTDYPEPNPSTWTGPAVPLQYGYTKFADGGSVPALVSNGEAYVPPKLAKRIGYGKLNRMNQADKNDMGRFASGGGIGVFKGPGTGTSDSIRTSLPVGSFIIREKATKALGLHKGGKIPRFVFGGGVGGDMSRIVIDWLSSDMIAGSKPQMASRPDTVSRATVAASDQTIQALDNLVKSLNAVGLSAAKSAEILNKGGDVSYKAIEKAMKADIERLARSGAGIDQILAAETALANVRKDRNKDVGQKQKLEETFRGVSGRSSGSVQQEILGKATADAKQRIEQAEQKKAALRPKIEATETKRAINTKKQDYIDQQYKSRLAQEEKKTGGKLSKAEREALRKDVEAKAAKQTFSLTDSERQQVKQTVDAKTSVSEADKKKIYERSAVQATVDVTGTSRDDLKARGVGGADILKYAQESTRDRKTLAEMDKQILAMAQQEFAARGTVNGMAVKTAAEAEKLAQEEISKRREAINEWASQNNEKGVGAAGMMDFRNSPIWKGIKDFVKSPGRVMGGISGAAGLVVGSSDMIAKNMYDMSTTEGQGKAAKTGAAIQSSATILSSGMAAASQMASIPVVGPWIAGLTAVGTAAVAAADYFYDFTGAQKAAAVEFERSVRAKEIGTAMDGLDRAFQDFSKDVGKIDLQQALEKALGNASAAQMKDNVAERENAKADFALKNRTWSDIFTGNFKGSAEMSAVDRGAMDSEMSQKMSAVADKAMALYEQQINQGKSVDDIVNQVRTGDKSAVDAGAAVAFAANPKLWAEVERKVIASGDDSEANRTEILREIVARELATNVQLEALQKTKALAVAMEAADRAGRTLAASFRDLGEVIDQAISRVDQESAIRQAQMNSDIEASRGNASFDPSAVNNRNVGVLTNPKAYRDDPGRIDDAIKAGTRGLSPEVANKLGGGAKLQVSLPGILKKTVSDAAKDAANIPLDQVANRAITAGTRAIDASSLSDEDKTLAKTKLTETIRTKEKEITEKNKGEDNKVLVDKFNVEMADFAQETGVIFENSAQRIDDIIRKQEDIYNTFAKNLETASDAARKARDSFNKARDLRYNARINLREAQTGVEESYGESKAKFDDDIKRLTGGATDPAAIGQNIDRLRAQRTALTDQQNQARSNPNLTSDQQKAEFTKLAEEIQRVNNALNDNVTALDKFANATELVQKALDEVKGIRGLQQQRENFVNQLVTNTPEEADKLNQTFIRLQRNLSGGLNTAANQRDARNAYNDTLRRTGSVREATRAGNTVLADQRKQTLQLMQDPNFRGMMELNMRNQALAQKRGVLSKEDVDKTFRYQEGMLMQQMAVESGLINNPMVQQALAAKMNPNADPAMQEAANQTLQLMNLLPKATEEQARLELASVQKILATSTDNLKASIDTLNNTISRLNNDGAPAAPAPDPAAPVVVDAAGANMRPLNLGINRPLGTRLARAADFQQQQKDNTAGRIPIYASTGKLINFKPKGTDTIPAMLSPGEFVVNARATSEHLPLLKAINSGSDITSAQAKNKGGPIYLKDGAGPLDVFKDTNKAINSAADTVSSYEDVSSEGLSFNNVRELGSSALDTVDYSLNTFGKEIPGWSPISYSMEATSKLSQAVSDPNATLAERGLMVADAGKSALLATKDLATARAATAAASTVSGAAAPVSSIASTAGKIAGPLGAVVTAGKGIKDALSEDTGNAKDVSLPERIFYGATTGSAGTALDNKGWSAYLADQAVGYRDSVSSSQSSNQLAGVSPIMPVSLTGYGSGSKTDTQEQIEQQMAGAKGAASLSFLGAPGAAAGYGIGTGAYTLKVAGQTVRQRWSNIEQSKNLYRQAEALKRKQFDRMIKDIGGPDARFNPMLSLNNPRTRTYSRGGVVYLSQGGESTDDHHSSHGHHAPAYASTTAGNIAAPAIAGLAARETAKHARQTLTTGSTATKGLRGGAGRLIGSAIDTAAGMRGYDTGHIATLAGEGVDMARDATAHTLHAFKHTGKTLARAARAGTLAAYGGYVAGNLISETTGLVSGEKTFADYTKENDRQREQSYATNVGENLVSPGRAMFQTGVESIGLASDLAHSRDQARTIATMEQMRDLAQQEQENPASRIVSVGWSRGGVVYLAEGGRLKKDETIEQDRAAFEADVQTQGANYGVSQEDQQEAIRLRDARVSAEQEEMFLSDGAMVHHAARHWTEHQFGAGWGNMTADQQNAEIQKNLPRFQQLGQDYTARRDAYVAQKGAEDEATGLWSKDRFTTEHQRSFFGQEKERSGATYAAASQAEYDQQTKMIEANKSAQDSKRAELDSRQKIENARQIAYGEKEIYVPERKISIDGKGNTTITDWKPGEREAVIQKRKDEALAIVNTEEQKQGLPLTASAGIPQPTGAAQPAPAKEAAQNATQAQQATAPTSQPSPMPQGQTQTNAIVNAAASGVDPRTIAQQQSGTPVGQKPRETDAQMYARQAREAAPRTPEQIGKPRNIAEFQMYREGLMRGMTIEEIKYERQQAYLSRFNAKTRKAKEREFGRNLIQEPTRVGLMRLSYEAQNRPEGSDPYAGQNKAIADRVAAEPAQTAAAPATPTPTEAPPQPSGAELAAKAATEAEARRKEEEAQRAAKQAQETARQDQLKQQQANLDAKIASKEQEIVNRQKDIDNQKNSWFGMARNFVVGGTTPDQNAQKLDRMRLDQLKRARAAVTDSIAGRATEGMDDESRTVFINNYGSLVNTQARGELAANRGIQQEYDAEHQAINTTQKTVEAALSVLGGGVSAAYGSAGMAASMGVGRTAIISGGTSAAEAGIITWAEGGSASDIAKNTLIGGAMGTAMPLGGAAVGRVAGGAGRLAGRAVSSAASAAGNTSFGRDIRAVVGRVAGGAGRLAGRAVSSAASAAGNTSFGRGIRAAGSAIADTSFGQRIIQRFGRRGGTAARSAAGASRVADDLVDPLRSNIDEAGAAEALEDFNQMISVKPGASTSTTTVSGNNRTRGISIVEANGYRPASTVASGAENVNNQVPFRQMTQVNASNTNPYRYTRSIGAKGDVPTMSISTDTSSSVTLPSNFGSMTDDNIFAVNSLLPTNATTSTTIGPKISRRTIVQVGGNTIGSPAPATPTGLSNDILARISRGEGYMDGNRFVAGKRPSGAVSNAAKPVQTNPSIAVTSDKLSRNAERLAKRQKAIADGIDPVTGLKPGATPKMAPPPPASPAAKAQAQAEAVAARHRKMEGTEYSWPSKPAPEGTPGIAPPAPRQQAVVQAVAAKGQATVADIRAATTPTGNYGTADNPTILPTGGVAWSGPGRPSAEVIDSARRSVKQGATTQSVRTPRLTDEQLYAQDLLAGRIKGTSYFDADGNFVPPTSPNKSRPTVYRERKFADNLSPRAKERIAAYEANQAMDPKIQRQLQEEAEYFAKNPEMAKKREAALRKRKAKEGAKRLVQPLATGGLVYANNGALISARPQGSDTVPAMLTPGEFVVKRDQAQKHMPLLNAINSGAYSRGGIVNYMANGGLVIPHYLEGGSQKPVQRASPAPVAGGVSNNVGIDMSGVTSVVAGLQKTVNELVSSIPSMSQVAENINSAVGSFVSGGAQVGDIISGAVNPVIQGLREVNIPDTIQVAGTLSNQVTINGAEAAATVMNTMGGAIQQGANTQINKFAGAINRGIGNIGEGALGPDTSQIMGQIGGTTYGQA